MNAIRIYDKDLAIAEAILKRNGTVTSDYLYRKCFPLFYSIFDRYHTGCASVIEFISEIYVMLLTPSKESGMCKLQKYRGESSLATWLKTVCLFHCYKTYNKKEQIPIVCIPQSSDKENDDASDILIDKSVSLYADLSDIEREDVRTLISLMPNERYRRIMTLRYLEQRTNEETAEELGLSMANYYNKHKLARQQYETILRKEALYD